MLLKIDSESLSMDHSAETIGGSTDDALLQELKALWQTHRRRGLEVRHETGLALNRKFGPPAVRQAYRREVLKHYSECLGISQSELSRMRGLAHHFPSLEDLKASHPDVTTWTEVKELLASLRQHNSDSPDVKKPATRKGAGRRSRRPIRQALRAIEAASRSAAVLQLERDGDDWEAVKGAVDKMLQAVGQMLGVAYRLEPIAVGEEKASSPVDIVRPFVPMPAERQPIFA
jgi:hypothetical protein